MSEQAQDSSVDNVNAGGVVDASSSGGDVERRAGSDDVNGGLFGIDGRIDGPAGGFVEGKASADRGVELSGQLVDPTRVVREHINHENEVMDATRTGTGGHDLSFLSPSPVRAIVTEHQPTNMTHAERKVEQDFLSHEPRKA